MPVLRNADGTLAYLSPNALCDGRTAFLSDEWKLYRTSQGMNGYDNLTSKSAIQSAVRDVTARYNGAVVLASCARQGGSHYSEMTVDFAVPIVDIVRERILSAV